MERDIYDITELPSRLPPVEEIISSRLLCKGETMIIIGEPGVGKSWLLERLCRDLVEGKPVLGIFAPVRKKVLWITLEMTGTSFKERLLHVIDRSLLYWGQLTVWETPSLNILDEIQFRRLCEQVSETGSEVILTDTFAQLLLENTEATNRSIMERISYINKKYGTTWITVQHVRKTIGPDGRRVPITLDHMIGYKYVEHLAHLVVSVIEEQVEIGGVPRRGIKILKARSSALNRERPIWFDFQVEDGRIFEVSEGLSQLMSYLWTQDDYQEVKRNDISRLLGEARDRGLVGCGLLKILSDSPPRLKVERSILRR